MLKSGIMEGSNGDQLMFITEPVRVCRRLNTWSYLHRTWLTCSGSKCGTTFRQVTVVALPYVSCRRRCMLLYVAVRDDQRRQKNRSVCTLARSLLLCSLFWVEQSIYIGLGSPINIIFFSSIEALIQVHFTVTCV